MKKVTLTIVACAFSLFLFAQNNKIADNTTKEIFKNSGEIYFKFHSPSKAKINNTLTRIISISAIKKAGDGTYEVYAYANKKEFRQFLEKGFTYTLLPQPASLLTNVKMLSVEQLMQKQTDAWDAYPTYAAYQQMMHDFQASYPNLCKIDTILALTPKGTHKILAARVTNTLNTPSNKPQFLYSSSMHGNELTGYVMMLRLIDFLLTNYGTNARVTNIVNNIELWICPLANPDGTFLSTETSITSAQRGNYNSVDLNRNYPDPRDGQHPDQEQWQAETQAFMNFASQHHINMSANFHDGDELINYPWDTWTSLERTHADDNWCQYVSRQFADSIHIHAGSLGSSYFTSMDNGVTEGGDWYIITGGRQDYMTYFQHSRESTIELSQYQPPAANTLPSYWTALYPSMMKYMEQSLNGVRGLVTDSVTGQPLRAKVFITGHDIDSSHVYSALPVGNYHRYLYTGTYDITFSAPCHKDKTIRNVSITNGSATVLNVQMATGLSVDFTVDTSNAACSGSVQFDNMTTGATSSLWDFGDGSTSTQQSPSHVYNSNGLYTIKLKAVSPCGTDSVIKNNFLNVDFLPQISDGSHCGAGMDTLRVSGSGNFIWYNSPSLTTPLDTGNIFITPVLTSTTTFYVQNKVEHPLYHIGKPDASGATNYASATQHGLYINCSVSITIISALFTAQTSGNRLITLVDSLDNILDSVTINIPSGTNRVNINIHVPVGNNLRLLGPPNPNLFRNSSTGNLPYPYTVANVMSITKSTAGANTYRYYYFFYDIEIQQPGCIGPAIPVMAFINTLPDAQFTQIVNSNRADFTNTSTDANTYQWYFGDGFTSTDENPTHIYADSGLYNVKLVITNACSSDSITQTIHILTNTYQISSESAVIVLYPNPAGDQLYIDLGKKTANDLLVSIYSVNGKLVYKGDITSNSQINTVNISSLNDGLYFMTIYDGVRLLKTKFVRKR